MWHTIPFWSCNTKRISIKNVGRLNSLVKLGLIHFVSIACDICCILNRQILLFSWIFMCVTCPHKFRIQFENLMQKCQNNLSDDASKDCTNFCLSNQIIISKFLSFLYFVCLFFSNLRHLGRSFQDSWCLRWNVQTVRRYPNRNWLRGLCHPLRLLHNLDVVMERAVVLKNMGSIYRVLHQGSQQKN